MENIILKISKDFTQTPGARYKKQGEFSGEDFRDRLLIPKFKEAQNEGKKLLVDLDGCYGFLSSFIDEAFGGLTIEFGKQEVKKILSIKSNDESSLIELIDTVIDEWDDKKK